MNYDQFRPGISFEAVRRELAAEQAAAREQDRRMYVTRKTVLGRMHYYKRQAWQNYLETCGDDKCR